MSSSVWYEESNMRDFVHLIRCRTKGGLVTPVWYEESSWLDFVCLIRRRTKGGLVLACPIRGIKLAGLRPTDTKSCKWRACPHPFGTMKLAGGTSSIWYEVARKESLSSSIRYKESSKRDFVYPVHSHANGQLVLVCPVHGLKHA